MSDEKIQEAINAAFLVDPRVYSFNPEVSVEDGYVTLRGSVDNLAAKNAAERDAYNTVGVRRVYNYLKVRPEFNIADATLKTQISDAMRLDPYTDRYDIRISVRNGRVILVGDTETLYEKARAEEIASTIEGVKEVTNRLIVLSQGIESTFSRTDQEIFEDVMDELRWSPFVDSDQIKVKVDDGIVTLDGAVKSFSERRAAETNALDGGAKGVINAIRIIQ